MGNKEHVTKDKPTSLALPCLLKKLIGVTTESWTHVFGNAFINP